MRVHAAMFIGNPPHDGTPDFLAEAAIEFFRSRMETVLFSSTHDHQGQPIPRPMIHLDKSVACIRVDAATEWDHRNVALAWVRVHLPDVDRLWIVDLDEFYTNHNFEALKSYLDSSDSDGENCWFIPRIAYWKDARFRVDPPEPATPVFCFDPKRVRAFQWVRSPIFAKEEGMLLRGVHQHHLSLTRSDEDMHRKWARFAHSGEMREKWWDEVWNSPDPASLVDLHPTLAACWKKLIPVGIEELPESVRPLLPKIDAYLTKTVSTT